MYFLAVTISSRTAIRKKWPGKRISKKGQNKEEETEGEEVKSDFDSDFCVLLKITSKPSAH